MNRKRNNRDGDWFTDNGWNIDDIFGNLDSEFRKMRKQMDDLMRDAVEGNATDNSSKKPLVFGFSVTTGPDGIPKFEDFSNNAVEPFSSSRNETKEATIDTSREPLTDVNETDSDIAITVELPGVAKEDITLMGQLLGVKLAASEFVAYIELASLKDITSALHLTYQKSVIMATIMLCGFANFASIGIQIGGIGILAPGKSKLLTELGFKAMIAGTLVSLLSATFVGMLLG